MTIQVDPVRRKTMQAVKAKDTTPELKVRRLLHSLGYRYRLHRKDLPGKPDLVFSSKRKVIFVHGCFWHGHKCKRGDRTPKSNQKYWIPKLFRNVERDQANTSKLHDLGWSVMTVWECELNDRDQLTSKLTAYLDES